MHEVQEIAHLEFNVNFILYNHIDFFLLEYTNKLPFNEEL